MPKKKADEHAQRMNFLVQAGSHVARICPQLNRHYGQVLTVISEKTSVKKDYTLNRSMCKKCKAILVPGLNSRYRLKKRKHKKGKPTIVITCLGCSTIKRFPTEQGDKKTDDLNTSKPNRTHEVSH